MKFRILQSGLDKCRHGVADGRELRDELRLLPEHLKKESIAKKLAQYDDELQRLGYKRKNMPIQCLKLATLADCFAGLDCLSYDQAETMFPLLSKTEEGAAYGPHTKVGSVERLAECVIEIVKGFRPHKERKEGEPEPAPGTPAVIDTSKAWTCKTASDRVKEMLNKKPAKKKSESEKAYDALQAVGPKAFINAMNADESGAGLVMVTALRKAVLADMLEDGGVGFVTTQAEKLAIELIDAKAKKDRAEQPKPEVVTETVAAQAEAAVA